MRADATFTTRAVVAGDELVAQEVGEQERPQVVHLERHLVAVDGLAPGAEHHAGVVHQHVEVVVAPSANAGANSRTDAKLARSSAITSTASLPLRVRISACASVPFAASRDVKTTCAPLVRERDRGLLAEPGVAAGDQDRPPVHASPP